MSIRSYRRRAETSKPAPSPDQTKPTIHHRIARDTSQHLGGCLILRLPEYVARIGVINSGGSLLTLTGGGIHNKHKDSGHVLIDRRGNTDVEDNSKQKGIQGLKAILDTKASCECSCYEHPMWVQYK